MYHELTENTPLLNKLRQEGWREGRGAVVGPQPGCPNQQAGIWPDHTQVVNKYQKD